MTSKKLFVLGVAIALAFAFAQNASATTVTFTVDTTGTNSPVGGANIANTSGNVGKYNAGSWLTLSGNISASASGISASGNFGAQKAASGAWSTGNPGSLVGFLSGTLAADIDVKAGTIAFNGGSVVTGNNYTSKYPIVGGPAVPLTPAIGGGVSTTTPGSDPGVYGVSLTLKALGLFTAASGTAALRNVEIDYSQTVPGSSQALTGSLSTGASFTTKATVGLGIEGGDIDYNLKGAVVLGQTVPDIIGTGDIGSSTKANLNGAAGTLFGTLIDPVRQIYNFRIVVPTTVTTVQTITGDTTATVTITTTGQVVGYANNVQVPEPATFALLGFAAAPLAWLAYRRRKRA